MAVLISQASLQQQKALAIVPKCTALLSLIGSCYIVYDVLRMPYPRVYHRLMLGMSLFDCMASSAWFFTTWPIPPDVFPAYGAMGNQATCTAQGYFAQLSISTVFYNGCLSAYYLLVIFQGWSDGRLQSSRIEYLFHAVAISVGVGTSSAAVAMGLFNPIGWDCWLSGVPLGCKESWLNNGQTTCIRGDNANLYQWIFFYGPLWIIIAFVGIAMALIVGSFYRQERAVARWDPSSSLNRARRQSILAKRTSDTLWQAIYYVGCFLVAWTFPTILRIHELLVDEVYYHWVLLSALFVPSQGLFNFFVYVRPRYQQICAERQKRRNRHTTVRRAMRQRHKDAKNNNNNNDAAGETSTGTSAFLDVSTANTSTENRAPARTKTPPAEAKQEEGTTTLDPTTKGDEEEEPETSEVEELTLGTVLLNGTRNIQNFVYDMAKAVKEGDKGLGSVHAVNMGSFDNGVTSFDKVEFAEEGSFAEEEEEEEEKSIQLGQESGDEQEQEGNEPQSPSRVSEDDILVASLQSILYDMADQSSRQTLTEMGEQNSRRTLPGLVEQTA